MSTAVVFERRNKQIQDAINGQNLKQALQLCEKRLKKGEDSPFLRVSLFLSGSYYFVALVPSGSSAHQIYLLAIQCLRANVVYRYRLGKQIFSSIMPTQRITSAEYQKL